MENHLLPAEPGERDGTAVVEGGQPEIREDLANLENE